MTLIWDKVGLCYEGEYGGAGVSPVSIGSVTAEHAELTRPYLTYLYNLGFRYIRWGGTDIEDYGGGVLDYRCAVMKSVGFDVLYGGTFLRAVHGNVLTPAYHKNNIEPIILAGLPAIVAQNAVDIYSLGNEEEEGTGTDTVTLSRANNVVTATFSAAHHYKVGDRVAIAGATPADFNTSAWSLTAADAGVAIASVPLSTTLTYASVGDDGDATGTITAKMCIETFIRIKNDFAVACRAIAPNMDYIYTSTENPVAVWAALGDEVAIQPGVALDYYGMNSYGSSATNLTDFQSKNQTAFDAFGANYFCTEWNLHSVWETGFGQVSTIKDTEKYITARRKILETMGVARAYYFKADQEPRGGGWGGPFELVNYMNKTPRNGFFALVKGPRSHHIDGVSRASTVRNLATPITAMRKSVIGADRGKCVNFNQATSYLSGTYPATFTAANLTKFSVAVRLFTRSIGGGSAGRVLSNINQKFVEIFMGATGYNCQIWHSTTSAAVVTGTGSINFNQWQTLVMTWDDSDALFLYPKVYLDGIEKTASPTNKSGNRGDANGETISIGNRSDLARSYDGLMDDFFVWNRILTQDEIGKFNKGIIPSGYLLGYTMDEESGNVLDQGASEADLTPSDVTQNVAGFSY